VAGVGDEVQRGHARAEQRRGRDRVHATIDELARADQRQRPRRHEHEPRRGREVIEPAVLPGEVDAQPRADHEDHRADPPRPFQTNRLLDRPLFGRRHDRSRRRRVRQHRRRRSRLRLSDRSDLRACRQRRRQRRRSRRPVHAVISLTLLPQRGADLIRHLQPALDALDAAFQLRDPVQHADGAHNSLLTVGCQTVR
jgi:hypothetical protein